MQDLQRSESIEKLLNSFHHPRSNAFSDTFLGRRYVDTSLANASRIKERIHQKELEIEERIRQKEQWLQQREQEIQKQEERHKQRQIARMQSLWNKRREQQEAADIRREEIAAKSMQAAGRGFMCRRQLKYQKHVVVQHSAANKIQNQARRRHALKRTHRIRKHRRRRLMVRNIMKYSST